MGNTLTVDAVNGNNSTATRTNGIHFLTCTAAKAAAVSGDTIVVLPGAYMERDLLKNGVSWFFYPGATVSYTDPGIGTGYGIFDDRSSGACTCTIGGYGVFTLGETTIAIGAGNPNILGCVTVTNALSNISIKARKIQASSFNQTTYFWAVYSKNGVLLEVEADDIGDQNFGTTTLDPADGVTVLTSVGSGIYWEIGEMRVTANRIRSSQYGVWCHEPAGVNTANFWLTVDYLESSLSAAFYTDCHSTNYRTWVSLKEALSATDGSLTGGWNYISNGSGSGGKHYVFAQKISSSAGIGFAASTGSVWAKIEKISAAGAGGAAIVDFGPSGPGGVGNAIVYMDVDHIEDLGGNAADIQNASANVVYIHGATLSTLNSPGVIHNGGTTDLTAIRIDTTATNAAGNYGALVSASGLRLRQCLLIQPALAESIHSAGAQTVAVYGVASNRAKSSNITLSPNAGLTVDSAVA